MSNSFGNVLRILRDSKNKSQLDLALDAGISTKHLSFLESGRAKPGREIVRKLTQALKISSPYQNVLYAAAGFSSESKTVSEKDLGPGKILLRKMILNHDPNPACAVDSKGKIIVSNLGMNCLVSELTGMFSVVDGMTRNELILSENGFGPYLLEYETFSNRMSNCRVFEELVKEENSKDKTTKMPEQELRELPKIRLQYSEILSFDLLETVIGHPFDIGSESIRCYYMIPSDEITQEVMVNLVKEFKRLPSRFAKAAF